MASRSEELTKKIALYRKWRPKLFADIIGQDHIKKTLVNAVVSSRISHAYIFCGSRGTGKTSTARVLAKAINCTNNKKGEPCNQCQVCFDITEGRSLDIIEIDGASNRGVDEIRELREKIKFSPSQTTYKVFIIDEVHMLTREAFNALLKTLEEPPEHAIFILVTTEVHKIPPTVLSRCQRFDFERIKNSDLIARLEFIAGEEKFKIDKEVLQIIASSAEGGLRDAISLLDQLVSYSGKDITLDQIRTVLGLTDVKSLEKLTNLLISKDTKNSIKLINDIFQKGNDLSQFTKSMIEYLRGLLIIKVSRDKNLLQISPDQLDVMMHQAEKIDLDEILNLINLFIKADRDLKITSFPQLPLELALVEFNKKSKIENTSSEGKNFDSTKSRTQKYSVKKDNRSEIKKNKRTINQSNSPSLKNILDLWEKILDELKSYNHSVSAFLKASRPVDVKKDKITLEFFYPFHKERIEDQKNLHLVEEVIKKITKKSYRLRCILGSKNPSSDFYDKKEDLLEAAQEIFGPKE